MNNKTIAIINDSEVTAGSLPENIISINAWEINWNDVSLDDNYTGPDINDFFSSWCEGISAYGDGTNLGTPGLPNDSCD